VPRNILFVFCFVCFGLWGCTQVKPIITPQEYQASCRQDAAGADAACATKVCDVYQAVVTDYYENMDGCLAACKDRAETLFAGASGQCKDKIKKAREACQEFCNRKFYRCNCGK
jgi:hypothetical protein